MKHIDGSWDRFDDYVFDFAAELISAGRRFVLVTLTNVEGSAPRPVGAQMVVSDTGEWVGYLSGGCIERAVVAEALDALHCGQSREVRYGEGSPYFDIQLPCGSAIDLHFDVSQPDLRPVDAHLRQRGTVAIEVSTRHSKSQTLSYVPRRRLVIFGVGPSAVTLCRLAAVATFSVDFYSPDEDSRDLAKNTGARIFPLRPNDRNIDFSADERTAVILMFHDHEWEVELLPQALRSDAFYIGALGSRNTHAKRMEALQQVGFSLEQIARVRGPAGLFRGSKSAPDIALSILAEVVVEDTREKVPLTEGSGERTTGYTRSYTETPSTLQRLAYDCTP